MTPLLPILSPTFLSEILDLLNAVTQGVIYQAWDRMSPTFWIPSVIVPALLVTHSIIFLILLGPTNKQDTGNR